MHPAHKRLLAQFAVDHLPPEKRLLSAPFRDVASNMLYQAGVHALDGADVTVALRKLLEAKDAFVRASIPTPED